MWPFGCFSPFCCLGASLLWNYEFCLSGYLMRLIKVSSLLHGYWILDFGKGVYVVNTALAHVSLAYHICVFVRERIPCRSAVGT